MLAVIDNYDSFTFNLVQYLGELGAEVQVFRNDQITVEQLSELAPDRLLLSPGPGRPDSAGITLKAVEHFAGRIPVLGVCLGHQSIGQHFGAKITHASEIMHGKTFFYPPPASRRVFFTGQRFYGHAISFACHRAEQPAGVS